MDELIRKQVRPAVTLELEAEHPEVACMILEQDYPFRWGRIDVARKKEILNIRWKLTVANQSNYAVEAFVREMSLTPDVNLKKEKQIASTHGSGHVQLKLREGRSYQFRFLFLNNMEWERWEADGSKEDVTKNDNLTKVVLFQVAVPLSEEKQALLEKIWALELEPEKKIQFEIESFLKKQDTFDAMRRLGIERIKARKLSEDDEESQVSDFEDHLAWLKNQLGI
jgi:hypothetical protein